mmetsp:Transcript_4448/g.7226  ORF Transcript_4448/g.7226 Transcript_4448/m.7226 type:complete len:347 (+) Transcript_4448:1217-2257(+)
MLEGIPDLWPLRTIAGRRATGGNCVIGLDRISRSFAACALRVASTSTASCATGGRSAGSDAEYGSGGSQASDICVCETKLSCLLSSVPGSAAWGVEAKHPSRLPSRSPKLRSPKSPKSPNPPPLPPPAEGEKKPSISSSCSPLMSSSSPMSMRSFVSTSTRAELLASNMPSIKSDFGAAPPSLPPALPAAAPAAAPPAAPLVGTAPLIGLTSGTGTSGTPPSLAATDFPLRAPTFFTVFLLVSPPPPHSSNSPSSSAPSACPCTAAAAAAAAAAVPAFPFFVRLLAAVGVPPALDPAAPATAAAPTGVLRFWPFLAAAAGAGVFFFASAGAWPSLAAGSTNPPTPC